jgi:hypothetical protein
LVLVVLPPVILLPMVLSPMNFLCSILIDFNSLSF